jgi:glycosyltransferase involved in cell wall biosynthesis
MIRCSVVVPTCKHSDLLGRTLDALTAQSLASEAYEIVVCDDEGMDATREIVAHWQAARPVSLTYVSGPTPGQGKAAMRNAGWRAARGEVVAFIHEDAVPDHDWLRQGLLALDDDAADAAGGRIVVSPADDTTQDAREVARLEAPAFRTANCFCRRRVLECVGGFDQTHRGLPDGGTDLLRKLTAGGFDVVQAIDAVVVHHGHVPQACVSVHGAGSRVLYGILASLALPFVSGYHRVRDGIPFRAVLR